MPELDVCLTPSFSDTAQWIQVSLIWDCSEKKKDDVILHHILNRSGVATQQYTADQINIHGTATSVDRLSLDTRDQKQLRNFHIQHDLVAQTLVASFRAFPRQVDEYSKCGPQIALEKEQSGLSACGMSFICRPAAGDDEIFKITVDWNLSAMPEGARGVCSFGEGRVSTEVKADVLDECFFMVGNVKNFPDTYPDTSHYGLYWLDDPPFDTKALGRQLQVALPQFMAFFNDDNPEFRIFIRRNVQKCTSGRGLYRGFVFAWNRIVPRESDGVSEFLFHEITHNWPRLGFYTGGPEDLVDGWWNEGIAEYYSLILPLRFEIFSHEEFVRRLNRHMSNYYTNPVRSLPNKEVQDKFWQPGLFNRVPYQRGFMFFLQLAYQLYRAKKSSLDSLIAEMIRLRLNRQQHHIKTWLTLVEAELGPKALKDYKDMSDGKLIVLPPDFLSCLINDKDADGMNWLLGRVDQEEFSLGFPEACLAATPRVVIGLESTSRAAEAGVREGDEITQTYSYLYDAENWDKKFSMAVRRESNALVELAWWPRAWMKVESYEFVLM